MVSQALYPYIVKVIPNFRAAHYAYIIFMAFFFSAIVFPMTSFKYIDILFLTSGACTQAGLNTVNLNELRLLQQILVYILTTLTTPIFIHSSLLFVRLYWFERHFDDIKASSKLNFRMRRNATLAARTKSIDSTMMNTKNNQILGLRTNTTGQELSTLTPNGKEEVPSGSSTSSNQKLLAEGAPHTMYSEPSDDEETKRVAPDSVPAPQNPDGIKFGELPHPSKRRHEVEPSDMYKSIAMLQHNRRDSGLEEDVLVIKSPKEIERDKNTPIYTKKDLLPFTRPRRPSKWKMGKLKKERKKRWQALKKTLSNSSTMPKKKSQRRTSDVENDNASIDSELDDTAISDADAGPGRSKVRPNRRKLSEDADDGDDEADELEDDDPNNDVDNDDDNASIISIYSDDENAIESDDDEAAESENEHALETEDDADPAKLSPLRGPVDRRTQFAQDPVPDRKRKLSNLTRKRLKRWRTPNFSKLSSRVGTDRSAILPEERDDDDEEDYDSSNGASLGKVMSASYLSWVPTIGRNSTFVHLTDDQKEELGGVEYRAIKLLIKILTVYYIGFHIMAFCLYVGFIKIATSYATELREMGFSPVWWGFFTAQSVFNDLGLTLTPNSMISFSRNVFVLIISCFFIVIGNTGFPVFLRFIIWIMFKTAKPLSLYKESLGFLLDHPRRCFTLLFPSIPTWWLFIILIVLNATDLVLFIILDLHSDYLSAIPTRFRVLDGLFQAFSTRTAGFSVVDLSQLHPAVQVSYMIMMYISVLPLAISIRRTNVYEEQSLGVYARGDEIEAENESSPQNFIGAHLRNQLSFDLWFIFLGLFIICIAEGSKLDGNDTRFTVFTVLFEIISAYGTVGLSLGYPNVDQSFSYEFTTVSKLVIIAMMIRGRHRGLPYSLDRAIMLPDANMKRRDAVQEHHAIKRAQTLENVLTKTSTHDAASTGVGNRLSGLKRTITRRASSYRRDSFFPAPTPLPREDSLYPGESN